MATGHLNPGYGNVTSRLRRARSAVPPGSLVSSRVLHEAFNMDVDAASLEDIRQRAKEMWTQPNNHHTTYSDQYKERYLDIDDITQPRPTSAGRSNKPHPASVFLTTRLHNVPGYGRLQDIPGYHNPDATIGKDAYRVDRSLPGFQQAERAAIREKYIGRPSASTVDQYRSIQELEAIEDPIERQGMAAYLKLADKREKEHILNSLQERMDFEHMNAPMTMDGKYRNANMPSLNRYMRGAGAEEAIHLRTINNRFGGGRSDQNVDLVTLKHRDLARMRNPKFSHVTKRGDFLMHPEWTPNLRHHRLNGMSSVDIPYFPGRR